MAGPGTEMFRRVAGGLFQQAFVVADLDAAQHAFTSTLGVERFVTLPATSLPYEHRGEPVECALALAFGRSGDVQIELLQPVSGAGVHVDFLRERGPGAHHLGFLVDDLDAERTAADTLGIATAMRGEFGSLRFAYLDTWSELGTYLELVEDPDEMMRDLMPWR